MRFSILSVLVVMSCAGMARMALAGPQRAWAHTSGLIHLEPNGPTGSSDNALDRLKIQELMARWGIAYDEGRGEVIKSLFTDDARFQVTLRGNAPIVSVTGREQIISNVTGAMNQQGDQRRHAITNTVIQDLTRTRATLIAYAIVVVPDDQPTVNSTVVYSADVEKDAAGVWRFKKLVIGMDAYVGTVPTQDQTSSGSHH
jgi:uncharacterized protein (TIGR02246 family)